MAMVKAIIAGKSVPDILDCAGRLRATDGRPLT